MSKAKKSPEIHNRNPGYHGTFRLLNSKTDIEDGFGLSTSASFRGLMYKVSGSAKYSQTKSFSADSLNAAGFIAVETRSKSVYGPNSMMRVSDQSYTPSWNSVSPEELTAQSSGLRLKPHYAKLLASNSEQFFNECGDGFVSDIYYGGRLSVILKIVSHSETDKRNLQASITGSSGNIDIGVDTFVSKVAQSTNSSLIGNYIAVGGNGEDLSLSNLIELKDMLRKFPSHVFNNDAGIGIRVISYAALINDKKDYRFGVADEARQAARLYRDLDSMWMIMREMTDGGLKPKLAWSRSVSETCLDAKQNEILDIKRALKNKLTNCRDAMISSKGTPSACHKDQFANSLKPLNTGTDCPVTPTLVANTLSQYDYRIFFPAYTESGTLDHCNNKPDNNKLKEMIRKQWLKPVIDAHCENFPEDKPECTSSVAKLITNKIYVKNPAPKHPTGGYQRSCRKCKTIWNSAGKPSMQCECSKGGNFKKVKPITLQCPQKKALQNCNRTLKYGKSC